MVDDLTRRGLLAAVVGAGVGGAALGGDAVFLKQFAPLSGTTWRSARRDVSGTYSSPYGEATVRYDDLGVPNIEATEEQALYYAVGFVQARDRLFQMDLQRRQMRGELAAGLGNQSGTVDSDVFYRKMDFKRAAAATWEATEEPTRGVVEAYTEGVNAVIEGERLPVEFTLLEYEPDPWRPADCLLMEKQISWGLTGSFETLRRDVASFKLGPEAAAELYPNRLDHDSPILRGPDQRPATGTSESTAMNAPVDADTVSWLSSFESPDGVGSNSWVVSGEHTESGQPIVANDPHLPLRVPPVWYEMNLDVPDYEVRGVAFPGQPFVVIGENDRGAWGFTNAGMDVVDFYTYERSGDGYRYEGDTRQFEEREETIEVADGEDREVTVRKSVHGPVIDTRADGDPLPRPVGVAWTGLTATKTTRAIHDIARSRGLDDFVAAIRDFDLPTQNVVYADQDGNTLYYVTGRIPERDGEGRFPGAQLYDGSAGEGEWDGFTPFGESTWEGFIPFEEKPGVVGPDYIGTANQRVIDDADTPHYLAESYSEPWRGRRLYDLLDFRIAEEGDDVDPEFMRDLQRDTYDSRADLFLPFVREALAAADDEALVTAGETLQEWDRRMVRGSRGALLFTRFLEAYRDVVFRDELDANGLDDDYVPGDWVLGHLDADSRWFGQAMTDDEVTGEARADAVREAMRRALDGLDDGDTYGDENRVALTHPFDQSFLNYPEYVTDGSPATLNNFRVDSGVGSSWRQVCPMGEEPSQAILPGGNSGLPFSEHYDDQLKRWANGEYRRFDHEQRGSIVLRFRGEES